MHAQYYPRANPLHSTKRQLLGNHAGDAPPAWRVPAPLANGKQKATEQGSKILLTNLPVDVGENEIEDLFKKTVGPLRDSFLIYNSSGKSKGMAIVSFQRVGDAAVARAEYDGKVVDGRRLIKVQMIVDDVPTTHIPKPPVPSLLDRLNIMAKVADTRPSPVPFNPPKQPRLHHATGIVHTTSTGSSVGAPRPKIRRKKGPRRIKKSLEQLDKEMEDYRAAVDSFNFSTPPGTLD